MTNKDALAMTSVIANRDAAGARYLAALAEFRDAYCSLSALDRVLQNNRFHTASAVRTFANVNPDDFRLAFEHSEFVPRHLLGHPWSDEIHARRDALLAALA